MNPRDEDIASGVPKDLDALPRLRGFRMRGLEMTRLETFIDAAFAFAITMMVISVDRIPDNVKELLAAFRSVPAFVTSVVVLGIFWRGHWLWSRRFGLEDGVSIFISWGLLATILVYIYPLRMVFNGMWFLLSEHRFGLSISVQTLPQVRMLFALYAVGFSIISLGILSLNLRAWQLREPLRLNALERRITLGEVWGWSVPLAIGLTSLVFALLLPAEQVAWSGWIYFSLALLVPAHRRIRKWRIARHRSAGVV